MIQWLWNSLWGRGKPPRTYEVRVALVSPTGMRWTDNEQFLGRRGLTRHEADVRAQQILRDPLWAESLVTLPEVSILDEEGRVLVTHRLPEWRREQKWEWLRSGGAQAGVERP